MVINVCVCVCVCLCVCVCVCVVVVVVVDNTNYVSFQNQNIKANLFEMPVSNRLCHAILFSYSKCSKKFNILLIDFCSQINEVKIQTIWL